MLCPRQIRFLLTLAAITAPDCSKPIFDFLMSGIRQKLSELDWSRKSVKNLHASIKMRLQIYFPRPVNHGGLFSFRPPVLPHDGIVLGYRKKHGKYRQNGRSRTENRIMINRNNISVCCFHQNTIVLYLLLPARTNPIGLFCRSGSFSAHCVTVLLA